MFESIAMILLLTGAVIGGFGSFIVTTFILFPVKMRQWLESDGTDKDGNENNVLGYPRG